jgi:hypothetical protein
MEALRLINCTVGSREPNLVAVGGGPDDETIYDLDVVRAKNSPAALRKDDITNALMMRAGLSDTQASNTAYTYIHYPQSPCGAVVAAALAGDSKAVARLNNDPDLCADYQAAAAAVRSTVTEPSTNVAASPPVAPPIAVESAPAPPAAAPASRPINAIEIALAAIGVLYFVPSLIGFLRRKRNAPAIFALGHRPINGIPKLAER